jgi:4-amino-4-deoxy-L-arabinose transferase-like glycosyltransferase
MRAGEAESATMRSSDSRRRPAAGVATRARFTRLDWLLLVLLLCIAIFFRFWQMGHIPPGMDFDEAFESLEARRILTEPGYRPILFAGNNGVPPLKIYLTALAFLIIGEQMLAIRYVSAITGVVTVLALYLLMRMLFPEPTDPAKAAQEAGASSLARRFMPFVAALVLAILPWHNVFSRRGVEVILLPLWAILAVLFLWQGIGTGRWWLFALSGFFWGSAFYTYQAAWFLPGVLVLFLIYKSLQERGFVRRYGRQLFVLALVTILVMLPMVVSAYHQPTIFAERSGQVSILSRGRDGETPLLGLARNTLKVAGVFLFGGDPNLSDNITARPPIPLALAVAFLIGLAVAFRRIRRAEYGLLLIWFAWMLVPSVLTDDAPSIRRAIGSLPPMVVLMALGMGWLFDVVRDWARVGRAWRLVVSFAVGLTIVATLAYAGVWSYRYYFVDWAGSKELFHYFDVGLVDLGQYAATTSADTRLYYTPAGARNVVHLPVTWQVRDRDLRTFDGRYGLVLAPPGAGPALYMVTEFLGDQLSLPALREIYRTGRVTHSVSNYYGVPHSAAFSVDANTEPSLPMQIALGAHFEEGITLLGSSLSGNLIRPGEPVTVTLFWQATTGPTQLSHTVFTHLVGPASADGNTVRSQHDGPPVGNSYPTTRWDQGEIIVDRHTFTMPADAPSGAYRIETGLYTPERGDARLRVLDAAGQPTGDSVIIGAVTVP